MHFVDLHIPANDSESDVSYGFGNVSNGFTCKLGLESYGYDVDDIGWKIVEI